MAAGVYYRFKSEKTFSFLPIDGSSITLLCLKRMVFEKKNMAKGKDYDLLVTNAQTNQEYTDDREVIPKHTTVVIRRVPGLPRASIVVETSKPLGDVSARRKIAVQVKPPPAKSSSMSLPTSNKSSRSATAADFPPELCCLMCKQVMTDAVFASKCCFKSFCDKCIRERIATKSLCACGASNISADDFIPNRTLRDTITRILAKSAATTTTVSEAAPPKSVSAPAAKEVQEKRVQDEQLGSFQDHQSEDYSKMHFPSLEAYNTYCSGGISLEAYNTYWSGGISPAGFDGYIGAGLPYMGHQSYGSFAAQCYMMSALLPRDLSELAVNSIGTSSQGNYNSRNKLEPREADFRKSTNLDRHDYKKTNLPRIYHSSAKQTPAKRTRSSDSCKGEPDRKHIDGNSCKKSKYPSMSELGNGDMNQYRSHRTMNGYCSKRQFEFEAREEEEEDCNFKRKPSWSSGRMISCS